jgi:hypothetical protein
MQTRREFLTNSLTSIALLETHTTPRLLRSNTELRRPYASEKGGSTIFRLERGGQDFIVIRGNGIEGRFNFVGKVSMLLIQVFSLPVWR